MLALSLASKSVHAQEGTQNPGDPIMAAAGRTIYLPTLLKGNSQPLQTGGVIADQTVVSRFSSIPSSAYSAAAATKTLFKHRSTGNNIEYLGLQCLAGLQNDPSHFPQECSDYAQQPYSLYDNRQWDWEMWPDTTSDAIFKTDQWVSIVNARQANYPVLGMKYCYVDAWNLDFDYYRQKMEDLERTYPSKKFIWATTALMAQSEVKGNNLTVAENIQTFNQQLRAYAIANNKILYDLAAIESHDPNGNYCESQGYEALCDVYYTGWGGGGGGHPNVTGSIRLAKGFWWLMARISGWNGNP
jgi:hypothetical protein